ncbi:alpha/beta hydrolase [Streptomyces sp. NPDC091292]|uniref:alpha/beta hydrolase n=1 Tax=Streptomyces sp. NPDC091292 TaxID=3365991 RepID=UPI0037F5F165
MGLTSNKVLALAAVLAVLLFFGTIWIWPRLARRSWRAVVGRAALLLATQFMIFATIGVAANQAFGFYASWADLFGQEKGQGVVHDYGSGGAHAPLRLTGTQTVNVSGGARPDVGGQIQQVDLVGPVSHIATPAYVYLPPEYFQPQYQNRRFPATTVLTGYPGTAAALIKGLHYPQTAHQLAAAGQMPPMILVMLRPTVAPPRDTECVDVPNGPQTETFFAKDLPDVVAGHYRVDRRPGSWGIIGDSTGGYCALKLALHHPQVYAGAVALSPYYTAANDATTGDLFQGDQTERDRANLMWFMEHEPAPRTSLLVTTSKQGEHNYGDTMRFIDLVKSKPPTTIASIVLESGGHNFNTWRREIPPAMQWLGTKLADR